MLRSGNSYTNILMNGKSLTMKWQCFQKIARQSENLLSEPRAKSHPPNNQNPFFRHFPAPLQKIYSQITIFRQPLCVS